MNHYPHHIGDFNSATRHLSRIERSIYRDALDVYYDTEHPLTADFDDLARLLLANSKQEKDALRYILKNFFILTDAGYSNLRCDEEIAKYRTNAEKARENGRRGGRKKKTQPVLSGLAKITQPEANQEPRTTEYEANASSSEDQPSLLLDDPVPIAKAKPVPAIHDCPVQRIVDLYHRHMPDNPKVKILSPSRDSAIKARWREAAGLQCAPFGYSTVADGLKAWARFFAVCAQSDWLTGKVEPKPGKTRYFADIDFLFSPSGFTRCIENKYHREAA